MTRQNVRSPTFRTTHWSMVLAAGETTSPQARDALGQLCETYWYPLYAYVRRKGYAADEAQDLTQEFFARLLARNYLSVADRNRGRFRSFLLGSLEHFLARQWTKARAQKRGGGRMPVSLDAAGVEARYQLEPFHELDAGRIFDRRWATALLHQAMTRLREECAASGKRELLASAESHLCGETDHESYVDIAATLNSTEGAVKVAVHRLRKRYGELIRDEVARTLTSTHEVEDELRYLFVALRD